MSELVRMRKRFTHKLVVQFVELNDHYLDVDLYDLSPKAATRAWRFTYDTRERRYYACLMRAKDYEAPFDRDVQIPKAMVEELWHKVMPFVAERRLVHGF